MSHMYESQGGSQTQGSHPQSACGLGNKSTLVQVKNDRDVNQSKHAGSPAQSLAVIWILSGRRRSLFVQLYLRVVLEC